MSGEWRDIQLGEVAEFEMGQAPSSRFVSEDGRGLPFLQGNAEFGTRYPVPKLVCSQPTKLSEENDVLISVRAPVGAINLSNVQYAIGRGLAAIRFNDMDANFGWHAVKFAAPQLNKVAQGSTFEAIGKTELGRLHIPFPPLPEQRRIAAILDMLDRTIEGTQHIITKLKVTRQGLLHDLLTRGLDETGQLRDPVRHPEKFKDTELGRVPREWSVERIGNICELGRGRVISKPYLETHRGIYPVYSSQTKDDGLFGKIDTFDFEGDHVTWTTDGANAGTVFFRTGQFNCTNVCGILSAKNQLNLHYLALALANRTQAHVSYVGNPKLMNNIMAAIKVPVPPISEQYAIIYALKGDSARIRTESAQLLKLKSLKRGLMDDLLTGRVRVPEAAVSKHEDSLARAGVRSDVIPDAPADLPIMPPPPPVVPQPHAMFRTASSADVQAISQWTRELQEAVQGQQVGLYSPEALDGVLPELLAATIDRESIQLVPSLLARAGVRFMLLPHPKGSRANGAAFYLDEPGRTQPVVGLSLRLPYLDVFWFNLLHELGHIRLNHTPVLDEALGTGDQNPYSADEQAANAFARELLIPAAVWQPFLADGMPSSGRIKRLATSLGRHPAVVAGRVGYDTGNWGAVNAPDLRPTVERELRELAATLMP
ncbi:ImmA/IrrE family metallo-endopeptidase [Deinococcus psychrotolerans]|uniref:ImmA/IrrE family metallo-endopeptidase n=1 Tax=Deinococcus psychrotolerans TaxID=2489213 RepID=A0A3G8YNN6_9DEIO|nr:restriction endonuclease subunit S [Deinococcus psychrotolerans]AZI43211.1 ImmA/IrrE family metallo-endopeptidase [Deinococcus psychrotolerans]